MVSTNAEVKSGGVAVKILRPVFYHLAFIFMRKSFVFGNGNGVGAISWCHAISY